MVLLSVAVAALAVVVIVDLVLSTAVVRRLRELEERIGDATAPPPSGPAVGTAMPQFVTADGTLSQADLIGGDVLVGFFATGCRFCPAQAEQLAGRTGELAGVRVVSVITEQGESDAELETSLRAAGRMITEEAPGVTMRAFGVSATPTFLLYGDDGLLTARGNELRDLLGAG
jgi:hypothetical protein